MLLSIILPTYNEAQNIIDLISEIEKEVKTNKEIIVVDDNSPDGTAAKVAKYQKKYPHKNIRVIKRVKDRGLTKSIQTGIDGSHGDLVAWMDCDFSHPPIVLSQLLKKINSGFDIAVASRYVKGGAAKKLVRVKGENRLAILLSHLLNKIGKLLSGFDFYDYTSGFVVTRREVLNKIRLKGDYGEYFINFICRSFRNNYNICEVGFVSPPRKNGESKTGGNIFHLMKLGSKYAGTLLRLTIAP